MDHRVNLQRLMAMASLLIVATVLDTTAGSTPVYAQSCSQHSFPWWYPPTYSYSDSVLNLFGSTSLCWYGDQYQFRGYSYGSQYPGQPLSQIRSWIEYWEESDGSICYPPGIQTHDSGWKYNTYSVTVFTPWHGWYCSGGNHDYIGHTVHYYGSSFTADTGYH